jgi:hypothetical protein
MAASSSFSMDGTLKLLDGTREQDFVFSHYREVKKKQLNWETNFQEQ